MGGLGFSIEVKCEPGATLTPAQFHERVWDAIRCEIDNCTRDPRNEVTTGYYLGVQAYAGLHGEDGEDGEGGDWESTADKLVCWFDDASGCCSMSMYTAIHWSEIALRSMWTELAGDGWSIVRVRGGIEDILARGTREPLVYLRDGMFAIRPEDHWAGFGDGRGLAWADVGDDERDVVDFAALTGHCQCDFCTVYRGVSYGGTRAFAYQVGDQIAPVRRACALLDETSRPSAQELAAATANAAWDWASTDGPAELIALRDALVDRDASAHLPTHILAGIVARRAHQRRE